MPQYKLSYFTGKGPAEIARQLFALAGVAFEDHRVTDEEWETYRDETPFGQMPVLEFDGETLAQSYAIDRFLARKFGFAGQTPVEEAVVDQLADLMKDYRDDVRPCLAVLAGYIESDKPMAKLVTEFLQPGVDRHYGFFSKFLKKAGSGFLVGKSVTWIDILVAEHTLLLTKIKEANVLDKFPEMVEHMKRVHSLPKLKEWIAKRPDSLF